MKVDELDRALLENFAKDLTKISNQMKECFSRASDIENDFPSEVEQWTILSHCMADLMASSHLRRYKSFEQPSK